MAEKHWWRKRLNKSVFVIICLVVGFVLFEVIIFGIGNDDVLGDNSTSSTLPTSSSKPSSTTSIQNVEVKFKTPAELAETFSDFTADKNITIENAQQELAVLLDTEVIGDFIISASSNYDGQYLANIKYIQENYDQAINAEGKTESEHRAFYKDDKWKPPAKPNLELIDYSGQNDSFSCTITGTVKNNTDRKYSYVQVEFTLYDESGAQVGTALGNITNLEPYGTWKFEAIGLTNKASSYKLSDLSGW